MGIDFYEAYLELEDEFGVRLLDSASLPAEHVGELFEVVVQSIREQHPRRFADDSHYEEKAWERYLHVLANQTGLNEGQFYRSAHFVRDLGLY